MNPVLLYEVVTREAATNAVLVNELLMNELLINEVPMKNPWESSNGNIPIETIVQMKKALNEKPLTS